MCCSESNSKSKEHWYALQSGSQYDMTSNVSTEVGPAWGPKHFINNKVNVKGKGKLSIFVVFVVILILLYILYIKFMRR